MNRSLLAGLLLVLAMPSWADKPADYINGTYGFQVPLPDSWRGFMVLSSRWSGWTDDGVESGPLLTLRHPRWTTVRPRQDLPILIFTQDQWRRVQAEELRVSAAPVPPSKLGENSVYVLALPPRYNFNDLPGADEVAELALGLLAMEPGTGIVSVPRE